MSITARQIEKAWLAHQPERARIPAEAWRRLRQFKRSLAGPAASIDRGLHDDKTLDLLGEAVRRRGMARQRVLKVVKEKFAGATVRAERDVVELHWLVPSTHLIQDIQDQGESQDCVVHYRTVIRLDILKIVVLWSTIISEIADHSAGRLLQRFPKADLGQCLFQVGNEYLSADGDEVLTCLNTGRTAYLPGGPGLFACSIISAKGAGGKGTFLYARADVAQSGNDPHRPAPAASGCEA
jgi:hypothetical protein